MHHKLLPSLRLSLHRLQSRISGEHDKLSSPKRVGINGTASRFLIHTHFILFILFLAPCSILHIFSTCHVYRFFSWPICLFGLNRFNSIQLNSVQLNAMLDSQSTRTRLSPSPPHTTLCYSLLLKYMLLAFKWFHNFPCNMQRRKCRVALPMIKITEGVFFQLPV